MYNRHQTGDNTMQKEIGGYFELENFTGSEYYSDLYRVNLGRTALLWLTESRHITHLYMPYFICDSVIQSCQKSGIALTFYHLDKHLNPLLPKDISFDEHVYLYLVNYYGQLTTESIRHWKKKYKNIIVDHTQGFYQRPIPGVDTIYSCRKYFGVSDGAYLATDAILTGPKPVDRSHTRMSHILGRYEEDAESFYRKMLDNAASYHHADIQTMSRLTANLMRAIDYKTAKEKREENYLLLKKLLPSENPFTRTIPEGPFAYPYYHPDGIRLRKKLAENRIFVQTNWSNVLRDMPQDCLEYDWAANILPLPCDQRYGAEEMYHIAAAITELLYSNPEK